MFQGCYEYIKRIYPEANFSPIYYALSKVNTDTNVNAAFKDLKPQGCVSILIHSIQWESTAGAGTITPVFTEMNSGQVILRQRNQGSYNNKQYFSFFYNDSSEINVVCSDATVTFIVEYQFLNHKNKGHNG